MRLSVRIKHKVRDKYGRHKENDLSDVSSNHNAGVRTVIVTGSCGIDGCIGSSDSGEDEYGSGRGAA